MIWWKEQHGWLVCQMWWMTDKHQRAQQDQVTNTNGGQTTYLMNRKKDDEQVDEHVICWRATLLIVCEWLSSNLSWWSDSCYESMAWSVVVLNRIIIKEEPERCHARYLVDSFLLWWIEWSLKLKIWIWLSAVWRASSCQISWSKSIPQLASTELVHHSSLHLIVAFMYLFTRLFAAKPAQTGTQTNKPTSTSSSQILLQLLGSL